MEEVLVKKAEEQTAGVTSIMIIQFVVSIMLKGSIQYLFMMVLSIQIIVYFPIYTVDIQPNTLIFLEALRKIAEF